MVVLVDEDPSHAQVTYSLNIVSICLFVSDLYLYNHKDG
jgi:hypothetical protein